MTDAEKYMMLVECAWEYDNKMPHDVEKVESVKTSDANYPEVVEIRWKSGGKSAIGNREIVELAKPILGDLSKLRELLIQKCREQMEALKPAAKAEAEKTRPWTYVLGVLNSEGNRDGYYSWFESNSWELYGETDAELLQDRIEQCKRFRLESTSRWHVYKRMRGDTKLVEVF